MLYSVATLDSKKTKARISTTSAGEDIMAGLELCNVPDPRLERNSQGAFPCLFRYLKAENSCGVTRSICFTDVRNKIGRAAS
jgi:hypothetical protein